VVNSAPTRLRPAQRRTKRFGRKFDLSLPRNNEWRPLVAKSGKSHVKAYYDLEGIPRIDVDTDMKILGCIDPSH